MIKFYSGDEETGRLFGFGLSEENLRLLRSKGPILIDLGQMGLPKHKMLIFYGKNEKALASKMAAMVDHKLSTREFLRRVMIASVAGLCLVMAQPLVIPFFGQILLDWGL